MLVSRNDDDAVTTLTLNRPDKLNAIDIPLMVEVREHIDRQEEAVEGVSHPRSHRESPRQQARRGGGRG